MGKISMVTDNDVAAAEQEAAEAVALVDALAERVRDGDEQVTPDQIRSARELSEFAALRAEATARKATAAKEAARRAKLDELAARFADVADDAPEFDQLFTNVEAALAAFADAAETRNERLKQLGRDMSALDIAPGGNTGIGHGNGKPEDAGLIWGGGGSGMQIGLGDRTLRIVDVGPFVGAAVHRIAARHSMSDNAGRQLHSVVSDMYGGNGPLDIHEQLRNRL